MDYRQFVEFHLRSGADITISVTPVAAEQAHEFGVMKVGRGGHIAEFKEKPTRAVAESYLASGEYFWNSGMFAWRSGLIAP